VSSALRGALLPVPERTPHDQPTDHEVHVLPAEREDLPGAEAVLSAVTRKVRHSGAAARTKRSVSSKERNSSSAMGFVWRRNPLTFGALSMTSHSTARFRSFRSAARWLLMDFRFWPSASLLAL
jgi:hypothetical protein